jgi:hypothetical protein
MSGAVLAQCCNVVDGGRKYLQIENGDEDYPD